MVGHERLEYAGEGVWQRNLVAASVAPLNPPRAWFEQPEGNGPTPLTFTTEGQIYGHLATWETCHRGFLNGALTECVKAPPSRTNYAEFYAGGRIETEEGDMIPIGRLTYDTDHAPLTAGIRAAARHYDNTGSVGGYVTARDGQYGIWLAGAVKSDLSREGLRDMRANPPSGDWRMMNRNLELIASLAVPVPGFPVAQFNLAASAGGEDVEVNALILTGLSARDLEPPMEREEYEELRDALVAAVPPKPLTRTEYLLRRNALLR